MSGFNDDNCKPTLSSVVTEWTTVTNLDVCLWTVLNTGAALLVRTDNQFVAVIYTFIHCAITGAFPDIAGFVFLLVNEAKPWEALAAAFTWKWLVNEVISTWRIARQSLDIDDVCAADRFTFVNCTRIWSTCPRSIDWQEQHAAVRFQFASFIWNFNVRSLVNAYANFSKSWKLFQSKDFNASIRKAYWNARRTLRIGVSWRRILKCS